MSTEQRQHWLDGWTAANPAGIGEAWVENEGGEYVDRDGDGFGYRDLGLEQASKGALGVQRFRVRDADKVGQWRQIDNDFDFLFVIRGSVDVEGPGGKIVTLGQYDSAIHPRGYRYRLINPSDDLDAVHLTAPAKLLPADQAQRADREPVYSHDSEDAYELGNGPRNFFAYRDLGTAEATDGRLHIHVVHAPEPAAATGWHYHSMSQWFMVLDGSAVTRVEEHPPRNLTFGVSQCLGSGDRARHNVTEFSAGYRVIELCLPAEYDTIPCDPPENAAP